MKERRAVIRFLIHSNWHWCGRPVSLSSGIRITMTDIRSEIAYLQELKLISLPYRWKWIWHTFTIGIRRGTIRKGCCWRRWLRSLGYYGAGAVVFEWWRRLSWSRWWRVQLPLMSGAEPLGHGLTLKRWYWVAIILMKIPTTRKCNVCCRHTDIAGSRYYRKCNRYNKKYCCHLFSSKSLDFIIV